MTTAEWSAPDYEEIRRLGSGATGRVVLARHRGTGGLCAVKYLGERFVGDPAFVERFRREAALLASVRDPHVVRLYDYIEAPPAGVAIVMEAVEGPTLRALLAQQGPRTPEAALAVLRGSLLGLAAAHSLGVVHRDYKPENVLVDASGESKLADFGIAAPVGGGMEATGTPVYMAPEQWNGWPAAPATDMYAASAVFFETLTGRRPYVSDTLEGLRLQHESAPLPLDAVPPVLQPMLERGLAKYPQNRHADATEFLAELERVATAGYGPGWLERGVRDLAVVAGAMAAAVPLLAVATGAAGAGGVGLTGAAGGAGAGLGGAAGGSGAAGAAGAHTAAAAAQAAQAAHVAATQSAAQLGAAVTQASQGAVQGAAQGLAGNAAHAVGQGAAEGGAHLAGQQGLGASANGWGQTAHHVGTAGKQGVRAGRHGFKLMSAKGAVVAASVVGVAAAGTAVAVTSSGGSGGGGTAQQQVANRTDAAFKLAGNGDFPGLCDYIAPLDQQAMSAFGGCKQMMQIGSGFLTFGGLSGTDQQAIAAMKTITVDPAKVIVNGDHATVPVSALRGSGVAVFLQGQGNQESIPWVRIGGTWYLSEGDDSGGPTLPTGIPTFGLPNPADSQTTDNSVVSPSDTGSASGTAAAAVDVCGLVTTSQVGGATGMQDPTVAGPVSGPEPNGCRWTDPAGNAVQAWVGPGDKSAFEQAAATGSPVPGLGDEAYSTGGEIFALSGDQEVVVAVTGNAGTGLTDDAGMAMAQAVIDALPGS